MATKKLTDTGAVAFLVMECHEGKGEWGGMQSWDSAVGHFNGADDEITERGPAILPEDNATIIFTSGKPTHLQHAYPYFFFCRYYWSSKRGSEYPTNVPDKCL